MAWKEMSAEELAEGSWQPCNLLMGRVPAR